MCWIQIAIQCTILPLGLCFLFFFIICLKNLVLTCKQKAFVLQTGCDMCVFVFSPLLLLSIEKIDHWAGERNSCPSQKRRKEISRKIGGK